MEAFAGKSQIITWSVASVQLACAFRDQKRNTLRRPTNPAFCCMEHFAEMATLANNEIAQDDYQPQEEEAAGGKKRKAEDGQPQQRSKRNRYISIACNEVSTGMQYEQSRRTRWLRPSTVQASQDQMQRPDALPALRQPQPRMRLRAQLLQRLQGLAGVQRHGRPRELAARAGQRAIP